MTTHNWLQDAFDLAESEGEPRPEASVASYLVDLQSSDEIIRQRGCRNLRIYVEVVAKSMSTETFGATIDDICDRLTTVLPSKKPLEVFGVVLAIDVLVSARSVGEWHDEANRNACSRSVSFLRRVIGNCGKFRHFTTFGKEFEGFVWNLILIQKAIVVLGHVARQGLRLKLNAHDLVEYELNRAFQWLSQSRKTMERKLSVSINSAQVLRGMSDEAEHEIDNLEPSPSFGDIKVNINKKRLVALFLLTEFAYSIPGIFQLYLNQFLRQIWVAIQHDECSFIREAGVEALRGALYLVHHRAGSLRNRVVLYGQVWKRIRDGIQDSLEINTAELDTREQSCRIYCIAGSFLALSEFINSRNGSSRYMWSRFNLVCSLVEKFLKPASDVEVREALVRLIPNLAMLDPQRFVLDGWMEKFMTFLLECLAEYMEEARQTKDEAAKSNGVEEDVNEGRNLSVLYSWQNGFQGDTVDKKFPKLPRYVQPAVTLAAIGDVVTAIKHHCAPMVETLLPYLCAALESPRRGQPCINVLSSDTIKLVRQTIALPSLQREILGEAAQCVSREASICLIKLMKAAGSAMIDYLPSFIGSIYSSGFSSSLLCAVQQIGEAVPASLPIIQQRIGHFLITKGLEVFRYWSRETVLPGGFEEFGKHALIGLGTLGIEDKCVYKTCLDSVLCFLETEKKSPLRSLAALTICKVLLPKSSLTTCDRGTIPESHKNRLMRQENSAIFYPEDIFLFGNTGVPDVEAATVGNDEQSTVLTSYTLTRDQLIYAQEVVYRLVSYVLSEEDASIRATILSALTSRFDPFLSWPRCATYLNQLLHDENLPVRLAAVRIFARLARSSQGIHLQSLNQFTSEQVTTLGADFPWGTKVNAAKLLAELVEVGSYVILPYSSSLMTQLLGKLDESNTMLEASGKSILLGSFPSEEDWATTADHFMPTSPAASMTSAASTCPPKQQLSMKENLTCTAHHLTQLTERQVAPLSFIKSLLSAIGSLCDQLTLEELDSFFDRAINILLSFLTKDATGRLWLTETLNCMLSNSRPITPYRDYPYLLPALLQAVQSGSTEASAAALRCIGVLGALDPNQFAQLPSARIENFGKAVTSIGQQTSSAFCGSKEYKGVLHQGRLERPIRTQMMIQKSKLKREVKGSVDKVFNGNTLATPTSLCPMSLTDSDHAECEDEEVDLFSRHAVVGLSKLLEDGSLPAAVRTATYHSLFDILKGLESKACLFSPLIVPRAADIAKRSEDLQERVYLLRRIKSLITVSGPRLRSFIRHVNDLLEALLHNLIASQQSLIRPIVGSKTRTPPGARTGSGVFIEKFLPRISIRSNGLIQGRDLTSNGAQPFAMDEILAETQAIIGVITAISKISSDSLMLFTHSFLPKLLMLLTNDCSGDCSLSCVIMESLDSFGSALSQHAYLVVPYILDLIGRHPEKSSLDIAALSAIQRLVVQIDLSSFVARIVRRLCGALYLPQAREVSHSILVTLKLFHEAYPLEVQPFGSLLRQIVIEQKSCSSHFAGQSFGQLLVYLLSLEKPDSLITRSPRKNNNNQWAGGIRNPNNTRSLSDALRQLPSRRRESDIDSTRRLDIYSDGYTASRMRQCSSIESTLSRPRSKSVGELLEENQAEGVSHPHGVAKDFADNCWLGESSLRQIWRLHSCSSPEELEQWLRRLTIEMIKESPMRSIRACGSVVQFSSAVTFVRELFPSAFLSCWLFLSDSGKLDLTESLTRVLTSSHTSLPDLHQILNLAEVMALQGETLMIDLDIFTKVTERCHAYAKALRYRELDWAVRPASCVEPLIGLYYALQRTDAALGVLNYAKKYFNVPIKESWSEKLRKWSIALQAYEIQQLENPNSVELLKGRMRCLYALGHWDNVSLVAAAAFNSQDGRLKDPIHQFEIAGIAAAAELNLRNYSRMGLYVSHLETGGKRAHAEDSVNKDSASQREIDDADEQSDTVSPSFEGAFFGAIMKIQAGQFAEARRLINDARAVLGVEVTALLGESYTRAYRSLVKVQQLFELEEIMRFKQSPENSARRKQIQDLWARRLLEGSKPDTDVWHSILLVRGIVLPPHQDVSIWLKFAALSRKQERYGISCRVVEELQNPAYKSSQDPRVFVSHIKSLYSCGETHKSQHLLESFCHSMQSVLRLVFLDPQSSLPTLANVVRRFPVSDLLSLAHQIPKVADECTEPVRRRLWTSSRLKILASANLLGSNVSSSTASHFVSVGLFALDLDHLMASSHLKLATWTKYLLDEAYPNCQFYPRRLNTSLSLSKVNEGEYLLGWDSGGLRKVLSSLRKAIQYCPEYYKVWKNWAEMNFYLTQLVDTSRRHSRLVDDESTSKALSTNVASTASVELCPFLCQLEQELSRIQSAMSCAACRCVCHEKGCRLFSGCSSSSSRSSKFTPKRADNTSETLAALKESRVVLYSQVRQHLIFVLEAAGGFIRSLGLRSHNQDVQECLRLLAVWFKHAEVPELFAVLEEGFRELPVTTWLPVLPQILARLKTNNSDLRNTVRALLQRVADKYPEALIFPLLASVTSEEDEDEITGDVASRELLTAISYQNPTLMAESQLVGRELIRISILKSEKWHETLEEASRHFYIEKNIPKAVTTLLKIKKSVESYAETFAELTFVQANARHIHQANMYLDRFVNANVGMRNIGEPLKNAQWGNWCHLQDLDQAWQIFYQVFKKLSESISCMNRIELEHVSPKLRAVNGLQIAVPGRYSPLHTYPKIQSFKSRIEVFSSKRRPRKFVVLGTDGREYPFLLKGHEDLKQDERVVQVLKLINQLLYTESVRANLSVKRLQSKARGYAIASEDSTSLIGATNNAEEDSGAAIQQNLAISLYSVVPLSRNSGLIEWFPSCDTLHALVKTYREAEDMKLFLELDLIKSLYPRYEELCLLQKVEAIEYSLDRTVGDDLREILWRTSENSEVWLQRRSNFTLSLAVMSMAGHVLGLGDRHPSNLLIRRISGRVIHIDFGDCFEVAMLRDSFPEKVPFRMLLNAMEIGGPEGCFRLTCERVLGLLRANRDAIIATLETFVYDPLVTWKLLLPQYHKLERLLQASSARIKEHALSSTLMITAESLKREAKYHNLVNNIIPHCPSCARTIRRQSGGGSRRRIRRRESLSSTRRRSFDLTSLRRKFNGSVDHLHDFNSKKHSQTISFLLLEPGNQGESDFETEPETDGPTRKSPNSSRSSHDEEKILAPYKSLLPGRFSRFFGLRHHQSVELDKRVEFSFSTKRPNKPSRPASQPQQIALTEKEKALALKVAKNKLLKGDGMQVHDATKDLLMLSKQAEMVIERIETKLSGNEFDSRELDTKEQVEKLLKEATLKENLAQCFVGWCAFW